MFTITTLVKIAMVASRKTQTQIFLVQKAPRSFNWRKYQKLGPVKRQRSFQPLESKLQQELIEILGLIRVSAGDELLSSLDQLAQQGVWLMFPCCSHAEQNGTFSIRVLERRKVSRQSLHSTHENRDGIAPSYAIRLRRHTQKFAKLVGSNLIEWQRGGFEHAAGCMEAGAGCIDLARPEPKKAWSGLGKVDLNTFCYTANGLREGLHK